MAKKILIIDDDPIMVKYLESLFQDHGYATCSATDGIEGLAIMQREKPDLITLDLQMPAEWGPRFYRKITRDKQLKDTPVIVISALDGDHAIKNAVAFVRKPFDTDKLLAIIRNTIG